MNDNAGTAASVTASSGAGPGSAGSPAQGSDLDAGSGAAGSPGGGGGMSAPGGNGGGNDQRCLPGEECTDGGLSCPPTVMFCNRCQSKSQCKDPEAQFCDKDAGRCAECQDDGNGCAANEVCHPLTLRCDPACTTNADCSSYHGRPVCDPFGACVSCSASADCSQFYGQKDDVCFMGSCVECYQNKQCPSERPYCVGLQCQARR